MYIKVIIIDYNKNELLVKLYSHKIFYFLHMTVFLLSKNKTFINVFCRKTRNFYNEMYPEICFISKLYI